MFPNGVSTLGSCPLDEDELDDFLLRLGIKVSAPSPDLNILVVGREEWDDGLNHAIEARRGKELPVYSQEMFLSYIRMGNDPLESREVAEMFGVGHPALEYIRDWGFEWPTTRLVPAISGFGVPATGDWQPESFLKLMGYTVGAKGRNLQKRRNTLHKAFVENLPRRADSNYVEQWGLPKSATRLQKIAERISINITLGSARGNRQEAVGHWLEDLKWLKKEYYDGRHTFRWPSPMVA